MLGIQPIMTELLANAIHQRKSLDMIRSLKKQIASIALVLVFHLGFIGPDLHKATALSQTLMGNQNQKEYEGKLKFLEERFEALRKEKKIPGMAVAVVSNQQVIFARGFGFMDGERTFTHR